MTMPSTVWISIPISRVTSGSLTRSISCWIWAVWPLLEQKKMSSKTYLFDGDLVSPSPPTMTTAASRLISTCEASMINVLLATDMLHPPLMQIDLVTHSNVKLASALRWWQPWKVKPSPFGSGAVELMTDVMRILGLTVLASAWVVALAAGRTIAVLPQLAAQRCECSMLFETNLSFQILQVTA